MNLNIKGVYFIKNKNRLTVKAKENKRSFKYGMLIYKITNITSKQVIDLTTGIMYGSASEAGRQLNLNFAHICSVARGKRGSTGGRVFRFCDINGKIE